MEATKTPEQYYVPAHGKISREVKAKDMPRVLEDMQIMYALCHAPAGYYRQAHAIAHSQINDKDPLRFFVIQDQRVIINPKIIRSTKVGTLKDEGCMTFFRCKSTKVTRKTKVEVEYRTIGEDSKLTELRLWAAKGIDAQVLQHEIDHFDGRYIYPIESWQDTHQPEELPAI